MPCTFGVLQRVFEEVAARLPHFSPQRLLDFGAGPDTAAQACAAVWPGALRESVSVERSAAMRALAASLRREWGAALPPPTSLPSLMRLRGPGAQRRFQLVVAAYSLGELGAEERRGALRRLWAHTADDGALVLVEPGTPRASQQLLQCREQVLLLERRAARRRARASCSTPTRAPTSRRRARTAGSPCASRPSAPR